MGIHIGIIPDGNRRYCKKNNLTLLQLVEDSFEKHIVSIFDHLYNLFFEKNDPDLQDINEISFYMLSADNIKKRLSSEVECVYLFFNKAYDYFINCLTLLDKDEKLERHARVLRLVNIYFVGDTELLPEEMVIKINNLHNQLNSIEKKYRITIAIAYDPIKDLQQICTNNNRYQTPIDLVIRTSGEKRLSGFFPYHSMYSELIFFDKLWPEFNLLDLKKALKIFNNRERRFGK